MHTFKIIYFNDLGNQIYIIRADSKQSFENQLTNFLKLNNLKVVIPDKISVYSKAFDNLSFDVKGEAPLLITLCLCILGGSEKVAYQVEHARISSGVRARGAPEGSLVHVDHFVDVFDALNAIVRHGLFERTVEVLAENGMQGLVDEG